MTPAPRAAEFLERIATREATIGVVGLGYAGLPLAVAFADAGFDVLGVDVDEDRVAAVNERRSYLVDVPEARYDVAGTLAATADSALVQTVDVVAICVPTPLSKTRTPDLRYVVEVTESVARDLRPGQLVVLQSTTYPGTTEDVVVPILERDGLRVGEDVFVGYAPERVDPGNPRWNLRNTPRLVSGVTPECLARVEALYATVVETVVPVSSPTVAETAKLHENTFRAVNIALANELALMCDRLGIGVTEVIDAAASKPFAFLRHDPGPGIGGECIPVVPEFLSWRMREHGYAARLIDAAQEVNASMPGHVVDRVAQALAARGASLEGARVLALGMAYKADVHDARESPSLEIMRLLLAAGAEVAYCDPWVPSVVLDGQPHVALPWSAASVAWADCSVLLTSHSQFLATPHWRRAGLLVDTRNVVPEGEGVWRI